MVALGLVGVGKIARDQHIPAIRGNGAFELVATADPHGSLDGVPSFPDLGAMLASGIKLDAVSLCTPPGVRHDIAVQAIEAGLAVMLEKPPAATLSQAADLVALAEKKGVTLFASWHSRGAAGVEKARAWLADRHVTAGQITWKEDIRRWHPGQEWILGAGGFGVFDPGINALSILTRILPQPAVLLSATMDVPEGRVSPLAATLALRSGDASIGVDLSSLQTGPQTWRIEIATDGGTLLLDDGGEAISIDGKPVAVDNPGEYPRLYAHFAELVEARASDVDLTPLQLVADAFMMGDRKVTEPFSF